MRTLLVSLALVVACSRHSDVIVGTNATPITKILPTSQKLDVLFVIDNSASTSDKQTELAASFLSLVHAFDALPFGRPDLHIGVVTSTVDIGVQGYGPGCPSPAPDEDGLLQDIPRQTGCTTPTARFISDAKNSSGGRTTNYSGDITDVFSCIAQVGATGCGFEAPLEAMKRALDGSRPENAGFIRDDAGLLVIIFTDEDDASVVDPQLFSLGSGEQGPGDFRAQPLYAYTCDHPISPSVGDTYYDCRLREHGYLQDPSAYVKFLGTIKDPSQTMVAVISGPATSTITTGPITTPFNQTLALEPVCTFTSNGNPTIARPGIRLDGFRAGFDDLDHGLFESICASDYNAALADIGSRLYPFMTSCLEGLVDATDADPANPGIQPACTVSENGTKIPACPMTTPFLVAADAPLPCWWTQSDSLCQTPSSLAIQIERAAPPAPGAVVGVTCPRL